MNDSERTLKIALSMMAGLTKEMVKELPSVGIGIEELQEMPVREISDRLGLQGAHRLQQIAWEEALAAARKEEEFVKRHQINVLFVHDDDYPTRLLDLKDPPVVLYQLGKTELNREHVLSVVGTRQPTSYGVNATQRFVEESAGYFPDLLVISGLALGIDSVAHTTSLQSGIATAGVLAHGLSMIYPASNRDLGRRILDSGGSLLTEYPSTERPYRQRFLERNRIVATISDATFVAESPIKGGAMSTASTAFSYGREVMALPGRAIDEKSAGCNHLIRRNRASLVTSCADMIEALGWEPSGIKVNPSERNLFPELDGNEKKIYECLRYSENPLSIDEIHAQTGIPISVLMGTLSEMEFDNIVVRHPGKRYSQSL